MVVMSSNSGSIRKKLGKTCSLWFCNRKHYSGGYCRNHYLADRNYGAPISPHNTDLINALSVVANMRMLLQNIQSDSESQKYHQPIEDVIGQTEGHTLNVIGRCQNCGMNKVARIEWPHIVVECGCQKRVFDIG